MLFQYDYNKLKVIRFLQDLFDILDKRRPKTNALADPNSGKNFFFFNCVLNYFLNVGHIGNINRNTTFPFQEAVNRRVLLLDEPNFETGALDTIKKKLCWIAV